MGGVSCEHPTLKVRVTLSRSLAPLLQGGFKLDPSVKLMASSTEIHPLNKYKHLWQNTISVDV